MDEKTLGNLKQRYVWGVIWAAVIGVSGVAAMALIADTDFWTTVVKPAPIYIRFIVAALLIGPVVYAVSILIARRADDYHIAKRQYEAEHTSG